MFNLTTNKIIGIVGGVAGISATGAGIIYLTSDSNKSEDTASSQSNTNKVTDKLTEAGYLPLKTDNTELGRTWPDMLMQYKKIKEKETELADIEDSDILKNKCSLALDSESTENTNYSFAKRFCVKGETIEEMLQRNKYKRLNTTVDDSNKEKWQANLNLIKDNEKAKEAIKLTLSGATDTHPQLLANACKKFDTLKSKTYEDKDFEENYKQAKSWCSTKESV